MNRHYLFAGLWLWFICFFAPCPASLAQDYQLPIAKARFLISKHQQQTRVPGIQVALSVRGTTVWSEGFGYGDLEGKHPVTDATRFRIASLSKSVTSVALGRLMEDGTLDIDRPISDYLPELPEKFHAITCRQLAGSLSGIRHYESKDPEYNTVHYPDVFSSLERFIHDPLVFEPGTGYFYSSYGWVLLSAVMERAGGKSFQRLMQEVWSDLGMGETAFEVTGEKYPGRSVPYLWKNGQRIPSPADDRSHMYAGGGYLSTARDLVRMGNEMIYGTYFSKATVLELTTSLTLPDGSKTYYGLGWECGTGRLGTPVFFHSGSMDGARTHLVIYPEEGIVFAYLANTGDHIFFNEREAHSIAELFIHANRDPDTQLAHELPQVLGAWDIETTSLRDKKTDGTLILKRGNYGVIQGELQFKRSRKKGTYPVLVSDIKDHKVHLIAVSPMFMDIYLDVNEDSISGEWLHDFYVKGVGEEDPYWKARKLFGRRTAKSGND